jgi:hypothetical protein
MYYDFSETALVKSGPCGTAIAQFIGFRFQVSGVREPRCLVLTPEHWSASGGKPSVSYNMLSEKPR